MLEIDNLTILFMLHRLAFTTQELYELRRKYTHIESKECGEGCLLIHLKSHTNRKIRTIHYIHPNKFNEDVFRFSVDNTNYVSFSIEHYLQDWFVIPRKYIPIFEEICGIE